MTNGIKERLARVEVKMEDVGDTIQEIKADMNQMKYLVISSLVGIVGNLIAWLIVK